MDNKKYEELEQILGLDNSKIIREELPSGFGTDNDLKDSLDELNSIASEDNLSEDLGCCLDDNLSEDLGCCLDDKITTYLGYCLEDLDFEDFELEDN